MPNRKMRKKAWRRHTLTLLFFEALFCLWSEGTCVVLGPSFFTFHVLPSCLRKSKNERHLLLRLASHVRFILLTESENIFRKRKLSALSMPSYYRKWIIVIVCSTEFPLVKNWETSEIAEYRGKINCVHEEEGSHYSCFKKVALASC